MGWTYGVMGETQITASRARSNLTIHQNMNTCSGREFQNTLSKATRDYGLRNHVRIELVHLIQYVQLFLIDKKEYM